MPSDDASRFMLRALALAQRGQGYVEPNPMVGCVLVQGEEIVGEGWHQQFGSPHAEVEALTAAGERARGATMFVTLEPCCHHGKTPPCTDVIIAAGVARVVTAMRDPFPQVAGGGLKRLAAAGIDVELGLNESESQELNAPYLKLLATGKPWIMAKWAMTLDGKIATRGGYSKWISGESSRRIAHQLRSRVDAILIGRKTAQLDDPLLTARPEGQTSEPVSDKHAPDETPGRSGRSVQSRPMVPIGQAHEHVSDKQGPGESLSRSGRSAYFDVPARIATRVVLDSMASLPSFSQLVRTAPQFPTLVATGPDAPDKDLRRLAAAGCEVLPFAPPSRFERLIQLLDELGRRKMTNVLVEGGSNLLGSLFDAREIDEVHVFIGPKLFGGQKARSPIRGAGIEQIADAFTLDRMQSQTVGHDIYLSGRLHRT